MNKTEQIRGLERKIVAICIQCDHMKRVGKEFKCSVKRSHCHSKRVQKWLAEIKELEGGGLKW